MTISRTDCNSRVSANSGGVQGVGRGGGAIQPSGEDAVRIRWHLETQQPSRLAAKGGWAS